MPNWFDYVRQGLSRGRPVDQISGEVGPKKWRDQVRNLKPFVVRHWPKAVAGAVLILVNTVLGFPQPLINRYLVDDVILGRRIDLLLVVALLTAGFAIARKLSSALQQFYFARFEQKVILDIQQDLLQRTLRSPKSFFDSQEVGYLMSRLSSDVLGLRWFFSSTIVQVLSNVLRLAGGIAMLLYLEWRLAFAALIILPGLIIWVRYFSQRTRNLSHQGLEQQAKVTRHLQESLSSTSLIKAFASEEREIGRVMHEMRGAFQISLEQTAVGSLGVMLRSSLNDIARLIVLIVGAYEVITGGMSLGTFLAFRAYMGFLNGPAQFLANVHLQFYSALAALERVSALYDIVPEETGSGVPVERLKGQVEFRNVSFAYDERHPVLRNFSFRIQPAEHVAIVGPSGVGKTTLISLILRFYKPVSGEIWFDDRPASEYEIGSLRRRIGYVSQSPQLISGTIMDNLRYGNAEAAEEQVIEAARVAGIHDVITSLPEGYGTETGERGIRLSEGQRQRLAIARALIKEPDILVLDEPTSALDSTLERSIFEALPLLIRNKTLFVVAHRLATAQHADRILLLNENRLIAVGTHESLLADNDFYRRLVANQQIMVPAAPLPATSTGAP